jgi:hypothetical protein
MSRLNLTAIFADHEFEKCIDEFFQFFFPIYPIGQAQRTRTKDFLRRQLKIGAIHKLVIHTDQLGYNWELFVNDKLVTQGWI